MLSEKEIIEGNRLIMSFMNVRHNDSESKYHSSWDWIMPVVEKIEKLGDSGFDFNILWDGRPPLNHLCEIRHAYTYEGSWKKQLVLISKPTKIEAVWHAIVQFIKWYNTHSLTTKQKD